MPRRKDLKKILLLGSGPIVIGQACEFDYSGTQALKALKEEGYEVVLVNSNPATIMTDPELAHRVYVEPLSLEYVKRVIERERPDAVLPTMGGQTALNLALALHDTGVLKKYGVEMLGAKPDVIRRAENRESFKSTIAPIGVESARSFVARNLSDGEQILKDIGLPLILRPSFTLGGEGGGSASTSEEFFEKLRRALFLSPTSEVLVEESLIGWKEYELEVVRDRKDNVIIVCSIENLDPMGIHTGDSITVAPAQTLTDREYQELRDQSIRIIRAIGVETGGSNIQFAINPRNGKIVCIEMNPRVSRSSALASKATGFPIARIAAKLAVGYSLDELKNDITGTTPSSFEPSIDYVVTKVPRFDFKKFRPTEARLTTQMKSVGEVMAIGRTFEESLGKALAGLEVKRKWLMPLGSTPNWDRMENNHPARLFYVADALRLGISIDELHQRTGIDPWFLGRIEKFLEVEKQLAASSWPLSRALWLLAKKRGWTDRALSEKLHRPEKEIREARIAVGVTTQYHLVDTCAAEFEARTPYLYSSYSGEDESKISERPKVLILGGGPNRIGQGIEFDYCCVHASMALKDLGLESIMINSNPETVSTDYDISDKLYFEPVTVEHVLAIADKEKPLGAIVQFGGQTPLTIAKDLEAGGLKILGTTTDSIDTAEDRKRCEELIRDLLPLGLKQPEAAIAMNRQEALDKASALGYPVVVRPSYVLGGRGMRVVHSESMLRDWIDEAFQLSEEHPVLIDRFLNRAIEVDVDAICDGRETIIGGIMEHIEEAGIHSGDSASSIPVVTLSLEITDRIRTYTREIARRLKVIGLMNIQFAILGEEVYLLEINPRASRTVPFVSKAVGKPLAKLAVQVMLGKSLHDLGLRRDLDEDLPFYCVKVPVFPFDRFPNVDILLGPEMKSTGEVMGRGRTFSGAYAKAMAAAGMSLPLAGNAFLSIRNEDKEEILPIARGLKEMGFKLWATKGTCDFLNKNDLDAQAIHKVEEGSPHCVEAIEAGKFSLIINTTSDEKAIRDSFSIRRAALERKIPYATVIASAKAMVDGIREEIKGSLEVMPL